eukprot:1136557-Pelagomonas_calceolata.AAC.2
MAAGATRQTRVYFQPGQQDCRPPIPPRQGGQVTEELLVWPPHKASCRSTMPPQKELCKS